MMKMTSSIYSINKIEDDDLQETPIKMLREVSYYRISQLNKMLDKVAEVAKDWILNMHPLWLQDRNVIVKVKINNFSNRNEYYSVSKVVLYKDIFTLLDDDFIKEVSNQLQQEVNKNKDIYSFENIKNALTTYFDILNQKKHNGYSFSFYKIVNKQTAESKGGKVSNYLTKDLPEKIKCEFYNIKNSTQKEHVLTNKDYKIVAEKTNPKFILK